MNINDGLLRQQHTDAIGSASVLKTVSFMANSNLNATAFQVVAHFLLLIIYHIAQNEKLEFFKRQQSKVGQKKYQKKAIVCYSAVEPFFSSHSATFLPL